MKHRLTQTYIDKIQTPEKPYWITDEGKQNLRLYVGKTGKVWYVCYRLEGSTKKQSHKLGSTDVITVAQARDMVNEFMFHITKGENPKRKKNTGDVTLYDFLKNDYGPWVIENRKGGKNTLDALLVTFKGLLNEAVAELKIGDIEKWRNERKAAGNKAVSCNRYAAMLKAALNWGVKRELLESNPLARVEKLPEHDSDTKVRYLSSEERSRLMEALDSRERKIRKERTSYNKWLSERGRVLLPEIDGAYADHIKPMVLISLNTGIRQGSLFSLTWGDIDFEENVLTLRAAVIKSGITLHLPMNKKVVEVLSHWHIQSTSITPDSLVFPSPKTGGKLDNVKKAWVRVLSDAQIEKFRWHDMRHDFASQLVMKGVDLNVVRELLGHSDLKMTLRYAHLAPESKLKAVDLLV